MWISTVIAFLVGLQPVCDRGQFVDSCEDLLKGEYKSIANAIFEAYLDQIASIDENDHLATERQAGLYLQELAQSLALLDDNGLWEKASSALSRSVLLQARQTANPWPATVWIDLSLFGDISVSQETNQAIDLFLKQYYNTDLEERYIALDAIASGNKLLCEQLAANAMKRWEKYQQIIEPYMIYKPVQFAAYPKLNTGQLVRDAMPTLHELTTPELQQRFERWETWHNSQTQATIALIHSARSIYLFDPWSPRCGASTNNQAIKLQQQLLQLSATVQEKNGSVIQSLQEMQ
ncbi:MAG TPA: hypothetical protein QF528_02195 [Phycisphaerales bacterium]|jgi:hypothetical protein|nr:hypothetical protein [Phycisphaerales bacterium]